MEILDSRETEVRLPYPELADSIREVMDGRREGKLDAPSRLVLPLPEGGNLLVMPAADDELAITKLVTVHPGNARRELPTIQGEVVVMEAGTGTRLGIIDGGAATARRTAALSLLAARTLSRHPDGPLLIVGAGTQARSHLEAFHEGLGVSKVLLTSRTPERAVSLAEHAQSLGMDARVVDGPQEALDEVSLIVTATTSGEPVLPEDVPEGIFVAAVGAFDPEMAELAPGLVGSSSVVVDTIEGVREEAGDLIKAQRAGAFDWEDATQLEDALLWRESPGGPIVFKSVGHALWDLAAARTAFGS
jgi:1-piperideine-2-carboxylate/1-pyrroline-2-carboxylate reductase [NAD(P)H]